MREFAVALASLVLEEAARVEGEGEGGESPAEENRSEPEISGDASEAESRGVVPLRIGGAEVPVEVRGSEDELEAVQKSGDGPARDRDASGGEPRREIDLGLIAARARLKGQSCRVYIERRAAEGDPDREPELIERMNSMIDEAKSFPDCFLWVFWRYEEQPSDEWLRVIGDCYEALSEGAELCGEVVDPKRSATSEEMEAAFLRFAEASSALRVVLGSTWLTTPDRDQDESHEWLRREAFDRGIYIPRFMKLGDPADPGRARTLRGEIAALRATLGERRDREKRIESLFNKARYHADRLPQSGTANEHDCNRINEAVAELERLDVSPADPRLDGLRKMVAADVFPPELPAHHLLRRAPAGAAAAAAASKPAEEPRAWSDRVLEARRLLEGGGVVIVGGEPRPEAIERIREAFALRGVKWVELSEHGTGEPMRAPIARPETVTVFILIKLCGHLHAEEARNYARDAGKPTVNLPAGYNPEQIAEQLLSQAAERLG